MTHRTLNMVQVGIDISHLIGKASDFGVNVPAHQMKTLDLGYLVHVTLRRLFGSHAPQPFSLRDPSTRSRDVVVVGYSDSDESELRSRLTKLDAGMGSLVKILPRSKPMPERWPTGKQYSFEVRVCPVARRGRDKAGEPSPREVDVFLREVWKRGDGVLLDRSEIYKQWLVDTVAASGVASVRKEDLSVVRFRLGRFLRRTHGRERKNRYVVRPDVTFQGRMTVEDGMRFADLLRHGVGRHKAFGFGMILLRAL